VTTALILGRFLPPHAGHVALVRTALALADRLTIIVCWQHDDPIAAGHRLEWMLEMFPAARIVGHETPPPQQSGDNRGYWAELVRQVHPEPVDLLVASDDGVAPIAAAVGARLVLIDPAHDAVPVSSDRLRADPAAYWRFIPPTVRPRFARTICLHGPESTGKSTLAPLLARHFETLYVPEYGRTYCEQFGLSLTMGDLVQIGRTHAAMTRALMRQCNVRLILDTDPVMTAVWADMLFERRDPWFDEFDETADLYLLLDIDVPWVDDGTRFFGDDARRRRFLDLSRAELERRGLTYRVIGGDREERLARALAAIGEAGL
jgi:HTH-type transcriptional regulator, transcriptional repressor of NAD biosynthesis genes